MTAGSVFVFVMRLLQPSTHKLRLKVPPGVFPELGAFFNSLQSFPDLLIMPFCEFKPENNALIWPGQNRTGDITVSSGEVVFVPFIAQFHL